MKNTPKFYISFLVITALCILMNDSQTVRADDTIIGQETSEKDKALNSGVTESQFSQIMNIPDYSSNAVEKVSQANPKMTPDQAKVVAKAKQQIGKPYAWGASGPNSFDCGGLVKYVYKNSVNIELPMGTINQEKKGSQVGLSSAVPGDLLFYGSKGNPYHVALYIGNGEIIHAPKPGKTVTTLNMKYYYPNYARRILSTEQPKVQKNIVNVNKNVMVNQQNKTIDTLPWGTSGYTNISRSTAYTGQTILITQECGSYSYSPTLKGWIDKKGIDEVIGTNCTGKIVNGGYSVDAVPWYKGIVHIGSTKTYVNRTVVVTARKGSYYHVDNLGWIDKKAFNIELQHNADHVKSTNSTTSNKRTITQIDKQSKVIGAGKSIDTLPWGTTGYIRINNLNNFVGMTIRITQESGSYVYSPNLHGWIDKKGLTI